MSALSKVFVVFVFILSVAFFGTSATLFKTRLDWKNAYIQVKDEASKELDKIKERVLTLSSEVDAKTKTISELEFSQNKLGAELKSLTSKLTEEVNKVELARSEADKANVLSQQIATNLEAATQEKQGLQDGLATARSELETAQQESAQAKQERDQMRVALDTTQLALHEAKVAQQELSDQLDTLQLLVTRYEEKYPKLGGLEPPIPARIKAVDPGEGLVVLSVGRDDGVQVGYTFTVYRGNAFIGKVKVIKVYPNLCGARVEWLKDGQAIQTGDQANTKIAGVN